MLTAKLNPLNRWPKIRRAKPDKLRVQGRCITTGQWVILRLIAFLVVKFLVLSVLAAALFPWVLPLRGYLRQGNPIGYWVDGVAGLRVWLRGVLTEDFPTLGRSILYTGSNPFDWHLLGIFVVFIWAQRPMAYGIAAGLGQLASPVLGGPFKVTFTRKHVIIHGWIKSTKLNRFANLGADVQFRKSGPEAQRGAVKLLMKMGLLKPSIDNELIRVTAVMGRRPVPIISPRRMEDAERILQSLELALKHSPN